MPQMQQMQAGQMSNDPALTGNLPKILAGFLLLLPGLISDIMRINLFDFTCTKCHESSHDENNDETSASHDGKNDGWHDGRYGGMGGAQGQNPFADMMRQMQDMQNQQSGRVIHPLLMVKS